MRAVTGSASMPRIWTLPRRWAGISAGNRPVPMPGSRTCPPVKPKRLRAAQIARTMPSGVKWAYWVPWASAAYSSGLVSASS